ncbi:hypothetical protein [Mycobacterium sp. E2733]|uniref:hypothetical protein n=1 Tax=Mycobacterium sp. E2733 TaxID=1834138 RepID=UPI000800C791|nr:hypothetical protein [Mycobacterium sp. E2733]OBH94889.1 hypothetical protein A5678_04060 [Mycobacterium sp. E2733]
MIKVPGGDIVAAINGSSAFGEVPRAIIAFAQDQQVDDDFQWVLSQEKNNLGRKDLALTYTIKSTEVCTDDGHKTQVGQFVLGEWSDRRVADVFQADKATARLGPQSWEVLDAVHQGPGEVNIATVAARTRMSSNDAGKYLLRLARSGLLTKVPGKRGVYDWPGRLRDELRRPTGGGGCG